MSTEITQTTGQADEPQESTRGVPVYRPLADIRDTGKDVVLTLEMPGVGREDVEIGLERRVLTIRGRGRVTSPEGYRRGPCRVRRGRLRAGLHLVGGHRRGRHQR